MLAIIPVKSTTIWRVNDMNLDITISRKELDEIVRQHVRNAVPFSTIDSISYIIETMGGGTFRDNEKLGSEMAPIILRVEVDVKRNNDGHPHGQPPRNA